MKALIALFGIMGFVGSVFFLGVQFGKIGAQKEYLEQSQKVTKEAQRDNEQAKENYSKGEHYWDLLEKACGKR